MSFIAWKCVKPLFRDSFLNRVWVHTETHGWMCGLPHEPSSNQTCFTLRFTLLQLKHICWTFIPTPRCHRDAAAEWLTRLEGSHCGFWLFLFYFSGTSSEPRLLFHCAISGERALIYSSVQISFSLHRISSPCSINRVHLQVCKRHNSHNYSSTSSLL